jgi:hypothetical protein
LYASEKISEAGIGEYVVRVGRAHLMMIGIHLTRIGGIWRSPSSKA